MRVKLPEPTADERAHSERVAALIRGEIVAAGGALDFARYMELALYAPGLGYYSAGAAKFGAAGDFVTAPELGFVFARCLARALLPELRKTGGDILELGPGSGALAAQLLLELERLGVLPQHYRLLETSADLRERQHTTISQHCPHLQNRIEWLHAPPAAAWSGALIANEVVDALPVRLFVLRDEGLFARAVGSDDEGHFVWREVPADAALTAAAHRVIGDLNALPRPYASEIRPMLAPWFAQVTRTLQHGSMLFIDYGYARADYYSQQRREGTLRCHFRQRAHDDPLISAGPAGHYRARGFRCADRSGQRRWIRGVSGVAGAIPHPAWTGRGFHRRLCAGRGRGPTLPSRTGNQTPDLAGTDGREFPGSGTACAAARIGCPYIRCGIVVYAPSCPYSHAPDRGRELRRSTPSAMAARFRHLIPGVSS